MSQHRTHHITTTDGVTIGGTVHGEGPPLVFVQGIIGDGDLDWGGLVGNLADRFTCHLPSMRGRGLSGDHVDIGFDRQVDDLVAYVESIGEPVGLVGWSSGAALALGATARCDAVEAVVPYGTLVPSVAGEQAMASLGAAVARTGELAADGRLEDAVRVFAAWPFTEDDMAGAEILGYFEAAARYVPNLLGFLQEAQKVERPPQEDLTLLGSIKVPVLALEGADSESSALAGSRHVANHVPDGRVQEIPGAGHAANLTHPEKFAEALTEFFTSVPQSA